jgi:hypothetical protein
MPVMYSAGTLFKSPMALTILLFIARPVSVQQTSADDMFHSPTTPDNYLELP